MVDVDNNWSQDLALNEDNIFQADECDAFDSDVDDEPTAQSIFMANLSSVGSANPQAGPSNASILLTIFGRSMTVLVVPRLCIFSALNSVCVSPVNDAFVPQTNSNLNLCPTRNSLEVRAMKPFENLDAEVDRMRQTYGWEIETDKKNLSSPMIFSDMHDAFTIAQKRIADLESKNFNLRRKTDAKCLISVNRDQCVVRSEMCVKQSSATKVWRVKQVWKATGKLFTTVGHQWRPTGRILPLGDQWPLTRNTPPKVLPTKHWKPTGRLLPLGRQCPLVRSTAFKSDCLLADPHETIAPIASNLAGLGHNLFSVRSIDDSDLEDAFQKDTCFVRGDLDWFTWVKFLRSKDETPAFVINLLKQLQVGLNKTVRFVRTDNGTEFVNKNLTDFYESVCITHEKTVPRTPRHNGVVERQNRTFVKAARTMMIFSKAPLFLWAEAVATACYTQNRSLIHTLHNKTPYELVHDKNPDLSFLRIFGALCYPTNDSEDLGKLKAKAYIGFFVGYAPNRKGYRIYNKWTRQIMETIHVTFDELTEQAAPILSSSGPNPNLLTPGPISLGLVPNSAPAIPYVPPTNKDLELLFQPMFDEYFETLTGNHQMTHVPAIPPSVIPTGPSVSISFDHDAPSSSHSPSSSAHQSSSVHHGVATEHSFEVNPFAATEHEPFVNVFAPDPNSEASSSRTLTITTSNQSTQPHEHLRKWTDSHPLDNIIGNPSQPVSTRKQLATDALWCFYNLVLSKVEPKNFKSAVAEDCWFQAMQDEIHEFDRLDVWELVPPPDCAMIIALKWIYKVKLDEYGDVLKKRHVLWRKDIVKKNVLILKNPLPRSPDLKL
ncbi:integrase, catalytic region, zinc finger, CCHC-type containing protein [Tanacetum coccineum]